MARKNGSGMPEDEASPAHGEFLRPDVEDARLLDLDTDPEQEAPFLRAQRRVPVRRSPLPKKTAMRLSYAGVAFVILCVVGAATAFLYHYGEHSWRFRVESGDDIEIAGTQNVSRGQVMGVMGGDIGRNIFFVPLDQRRTQLEQLPWVESAVVERFVPNRLRVELHERTPVAFARVGSRIALIDATGHLMEIPAHGKQKFSFPVVLGAGDSEPLSTRAARMKVYGELIHDLDSGGARYSQDLSEVDLTDPDDAKALVDDSAGDVLVHLGSGNYQERYKVFVSHAQEWRQQFDKLESVDLRYDRQIIVNPDLHGAPKQAPLTPAAAKAAVAVGVPAVAIAAAAIVKHQANQLKPPPVATHSAKPVRVKTAKKKKRSRTLSAQKKAGPRPGTAASTVQPAGIKKLIGPALPPKAPAQPQQKTASQSKTTPLPTPTTAASSTAASTTKTSASGKPSAGIPKDSTN